MPDLLPPDDRTIDDDEFLYRRIYPAPQNLVQSPNGNGYRPASGSLTDRLPLSVDRSLLCTPEETRDRDLSKPFHVAQIFVSVVRAAGCRVVADPKDDNLAHVLIYGSGENGSLSKSQTRNIARQALIILINGIAPEPPGL